MASATPTPPAKERPVESKSTIELVRQIIQESSDLIQQEFQLLREEVSNALGRAGIASGKLMAGSVIIVLAVGFLGYSLIVLLSGFITPWVSALIVGVAFLLVGGLLVLSSISNFRSISMAPRTVETLKEDAEWLRHPTKPEGR